MIRAKFVVISVNKFDTEAGYTLPHEKVMLEPVMSGSKENESFSKWTPTGELTMTITNPSVFGFFEKDAEFYLDITPALKTPEAK